MDTAPEKCNAGLAFICIDFPYLAGNKPCILYVNIGIIPNKLK